MDISQAAALPPYNNMEEIKIICGVKLKWTYITN